MGVAVADVLAGVAEGWAVAAVTEVLGLAGVLGGGAALGTGGPLQEATASATAATATIRGPIMPSPLRW